MTTIIKKTESARGCGYRKPGGFYLVSAGIGSPCFKLPILLEVCPCCGSGIKPARGFTWINSSLFAGPCGKNQTAQGCGSCPLGIPGQKMGLLWVGEKFYKFPADFTREAIVKGISRRISQIPHDFEIGKTWIVLGHRRAIAQFFHFGETTMLAQKSEPSVTYKPGIFHAFRPSAIEYVVTGKETDEDLERLTRRGITPVEVVRDIDLQT